MVFVNPVTYVFEYQRTYYFYYCSALTFTTNIEILLATDSISKFIL